MLIEDFLGSAQSGLDGQVQIDPLSERDALQESQLLEVRLDALRSVVGLLFELRTAMHLTEGNTGLLVARGVREVAWSADPRITDRTAWSVVGSVPGTTEELYSLSLDFWPPAGLRIVAEGAEFYGVDVDELAQQLPDYGIDDEATIRSNLAGWQSSFLPKWATRTSRSMS